MSDRYGGSLDRVRNIGIMAHIDAGKTTTTERILFYTGRTRRMGEVDDGEAVMDWMDLERERGITITSAATSCAWRGHQVNIIDTPGHVDFTAEVERSLRILDGAVAVFCAVAGVQPQSEAVWRQADDHRVPRVVFVNKMDRTAASLDGVVAEIRESLGANALAVQMPLFRDGTFRGVVDLVGLRALWWDGPSLGMRVDQAEIPAAIRAEAVDRRHALVESLSEIDEALLEEYLAGGDPAPESIGAALRRCTVHRAAFPVLCGAALRNVGVQRLLDAVVDYLPSPREAPAVHAVDAETGELVECPPEADAPLAALAFKVAAEPHLGRLTYVRLYSGRLSVGDRVWNATRRVEERVSRLLRVHANRREDVSEETAGGIVAVAGLRGTATGDTLCDSSRRVLLESIVFPEPMVSLVLEPKSRADQERLAEGVARLEEEDPTFRSRYDAQTGEVVVSGMGELHLDVAVERLEREHGARVTIGSPHVAYRESVSERAEAEWRMERTGGWGHFAQVLVSVEPRRGESSDWSCVFEDATAPGSLPAEYVDAVRVGVEQAEASGTLAGYPVVGVRTVLLGGTFRAGDSEVESFVAAGSMAFRAAFERAGPVLLEPIVAVEVVAPDEHLGELIAQLSAKGAVVQGVEAREGRMAVRAFAPLRGMLGYAREVRSASRGRGTYTMQFAGYRPTPAAVRMDVVRRARGELG